MTGSITVVIPTYNYGAFLAEAVDSVLRQSRIPQQIIVSDDCSSDDSYAIACGYQTRYPGLIRVFRNEFNLGVVNHLDRAVGLAETDYVCVLDADNRYRPDFLEKSAALLESDPRAAVAYTDFALFGSNAPLVYRGFPEPWQGPIMNEEFWVVKFPDFNPQTMRYLLAVGNFIHGNSLYRRAAFESVGGYLIEPGIPEDYSLFRRMIMRGWRAHHLGEPLLEYRQHSDRQVNVIAHDPSKQAAGADSPTAPARRIFAAVSTRDTARAAFAGFRSFLSSHEMLPQDECYIIDNDRSLDAAVVKKLFPRLNIVLNCEPLSQAENCEQLRRLAAARNAALCLVAAPEFS